MRLEHALSIEQGDVVAFIGAGGKTSALMRLGHELSKRGLRVLATTTTRIAVDELLHMPHSVAVSPDLRESGQVARGLSDKRYVFVYDSIQKTKVRGIEPETVSMLLDRISSDVLLIEADGARRLPFKAPYSHEPVVPPEVTKIVISVGMDVLGQPLDDEHVYNAEAMIARYGYPEGSPVVWPWIAAILRDEQLGLANLPENVPIYILLNKTPEGGVQRRRAQLLAGLLLRCSRIHGVLLGEMHALDDPIHELRRPVAALVLAAGLSSRMGKLKVLLPWGKQTVLEAIIRQLYMARVDQIVVVTGRAHEQVAQVAQAYGASVVHNRDFESGEMLSSLQVGLNTLPGRCGGALVVLGDQPQMQSYVVSRVLDAFAAGCGSLVIPSVMKRRGHPVLFGRDLWEELLLLPSGGMPRDVVNAHADEIAYVDVNTTSILEDIDTIADYQAALRRAGLA